MNKKQKRKLIETTIAIVLYLIMYTIPSLVILNVVDISSLTLAWILLFVLLFVGAERLYASLISNGFWKIK